MHRDRAIEAGLGNRRPRGGCNGRAVQIDDERPRERAERQRLAVMQVTSGRRWLAHRGEERSGIQERARFGTDVDRHILREHADEPVVIEVWVRDDHDE